MAIKESIQYKQPPAATDELGDPTGPAQEWSAALGGCTIWPRTSIETGTEVIIDGLGVFLPREEPRLDARGQVKARGKTWDIDGVPGFFAGKGQIVYLKRVGS